MVKNLFNKINSLIYLYIYIYMRPYVDYQYLKRNRNTNEIEEPLISSTEITTTSNPYINTINSGTSNFTTSYRGLCAWNGGTSSIQGFRHRIGCNSQQCLSVQTVTPTDPDTVILEVSKGPISSTSRLFQVRSNKTQIIQPLELASNIDIDNFPYTLNLPDSDSDHSKIGYRGMAIFDGTTDTTLDDSFKHRIGCQQRNCLEIKIVDNQALADSNKLLQMSHGLSGSEVLDFRFFGNGHAVARGNFGDAMLDYAEIFEWFDGNPNGDDRYGMLVCFEEGTNMIRLCIDKSMNFDIPFGVTKPSGTSSFVGGTHMQWPGIIIKDEWGRDMKDENGMEILNPEYNPDIEYIKRENRKEWACVGLVGVCPIRVDQIELDCFPKNWIRMNQINDNLINYLIK